MGQNNQHLMNWNNSSHQHRSLCFLIRQNTFDLRCICICHRCRSIPTLWWWEVETSWICVYKSLRDRAQLCDSWQGIAISDLWTRGMATYPRRYQHKVEILNDNLLLHSSKPQLLPSSLYLSCFDFELIHRPGHHSTKPDPLSRWVDHKRKRITRTKFSLDPSCSISMQPFVHPQLELRWFLEKGTCFWNGYKTV